MNDPVTNDNVALPLFLGEEHPCGYLADRTARSEIAFISYLPGILYQILMDRGFRRSGAIFYRPVCEGCRECVPIRVPVRGFRPSRSQRRVLHRNLDVRIAIGRPECTQEKWELYRTYTAGRHEKEAGESIEDFARFLYAKATDSEEFCYYVGDRLIGVGLIDVTPQCLSSVYFYFDPAESDRSLGTYSILMEIQECARRGLPYWYGGFYVRDCGKMNYKAAVGDHELLGPDGRWHAAPRRLSLP